MEKNGEKLTGEITDHYTCKYAIYSGAILNFYSFSNVDQGHIILFIFEKLFLLGFQREKHQSSSKGMTNVNDCE